MTKGPDMVRTMMSNKLSSAFVAILLGLLTLLSPLNGLAQPQDLAKALRAETVATSLVNHDGPVGFAHEKSDLLPDPNVIFGRLPNGMTYVIKRNLLPPELPR